jgi:hypothetical protein
MYHCFCPTVYVVLQIPWYHALIAAMVVSGVIEFAIKEDPPDTDEYDPAQDQLWAAADSEKNDTGPAETETHMEDPLNALRNGYARGELTEKQFERTVETLLETESMDDAERTEQARDLLTGHND